LIESSGEKKERHHDKSAEDIEELIIVLYPGADTEQESSESCTCKETYEYGQPTACAPKTTKEIYHGAIYDYGEGGSQHCA